MKNKGISSQMLSGSSTSSSGAQTTSSDSSTQHNRPNRGSYLAALVLVGSIIQVPVVASIITILAYITPSFKNALGIGNNYNWAALAIGIVGSLLIWLVLSSFCMRFTTPNGANAFEYGHIKNQLLFIKTKAIAWNTKLSATSTTSTNDDIADLQTFIDAIEKELKSNDQSWVLGNGYISIWNKIHRAEEVMLSLMPTEEVIQQALYDESRLKDSNISDRNELISKLRMAVSDLSTESVKYLSKTDDQDLHNPADAQKQSQGSKNISEISSQKQAQGVLKYIRQRINDFNDFRWEGVIRIRNQLIGTALITGIFTFVLLCIPIIQSVNISLIVSAVIFYLVGSITGFFSRLYADSRSPTAVNDYGLSQARLFVIPVLSGFAGIAGIFIRAQLAPVAPTTESLFELSLQNIVVAATFGLSPNLVISALQQKAQGFLNDIESSKPPGQLI